MQEQGLPSGDSSNVVRLHVAGLGPAVLSSDLVETFSSLVHVSSVDIVRTKGRSFAYITAEAKPRDIKRLFSLYNGCLWKGGRLKLETARELYIDKLRQEWAERDHPQDLNPEKHDSGSQVRKPSKLKTTSALSMYFPTLRKIKKIPAKGLGRHKRSFERVEPLPHSQLLLCNCDEDCKASSDHQSFNKKEPIDIKSTFERRENFKRSGMHGKAIFEQQMRVRAESCVDKVTITDNGLSMNIQGGKPNAETADIKGTVDFDEPLLNVSGWISSDGRLDRNSNGHGFQEEDAPTKPAQKKQMKSQQEMLSEKECRLQRNIDNGKRQMLQGQDLLENKCSKTLAGRNWVQKAPWKSLVGGTIQMSFSLGSVLNYGDSHTI